MRAKYAAMSPRTRTTCSRARTARRKYPSQLRVRNLPRPPRRPSSGSRTNRSCGCRLRKRGRRRQDNGAVHDDARGRGGAGIEGAHGGDVKRALQTERGHSTLPHTRRYAEARASGADLGLRPPREYYTARLPAREHMPGKPLISEQRRRMQIDVGPVILSIDGRGRCLGTMGLRSCRAT